MRIYLAVLVVIISFSQGIYACELTQFLAKFTVIPNKKSPMPVTPNFEVKKIARAVRADTCGYGNAFMELRLKTLPKFKQGYSFEVVKGKLDSNFFLGKEVTSIVRDQKNYTLRWNDGNSNTQEPFNIVLKITAISQSGLKSKPQFLNVKHKGVSFPWWNIWKRLPFSISQAIESY